MMTLKNTAETTRLAKRNRLGIGLAFVLIALGLFINQVQADLKFQANGKEFDLIPNLIGDQLASDSVISKKGGFLVWHDNATDESGFGISAIRIDVNSNPVGSPFRVNAQHLGNQEKPQVGLLESGAGFFAWEGGATGFRRVKYRVTNELGAFSSEERFAIGPNSGEQTDPAIAVLKNGKVMLSWTDYLEDGSMKGVAAKLVDQQGETIVDSIRLNHFTAGNQYGAELQALPNGSVAAVWVSDQQQDKASMDVVARVFNSLGQPITNEVIVSKKGISADPVIGVTDDRLMVAWEQLNLKDAKARWDIHVRSYDFNLKPVSEQVIANTTIHGDQFDVNLKGGAGGAILVWNSIGQDGSRETVMGRYVNEKGLFEGKEFQVNTQVNAGQIQPNVSTNADGDWLVTWSTPRRGNVGLDVVAQRFGVESTNEEPLEPISVVFVNPLSESDLLVSWPKMMGMEVQQFEIYLDDNPNPKTVNNNFLVWKGLQPGREYAFRVGYVSQDGRKSPLSNYGFNKTWGRDYNNDGLPDDWQRGHFGNNSAKWPSGTLDTDGDGVANMEEFMAGTDPMDVSSVLVMEVTVLEKGHRISWESEPGFVYQLEMTSNLKNFQETIWVPEGDPIIAADNISGITVKMVDNLSFFRIKRIR